MATLRTLGWINWTDHVGGRKPERTCKELVIPLHKIVCIADQDHKTCLVAIDGNCAYHIDVPIDQMRMILDEHHRNPAKNFDTHPDIDEPAKN